MIYRLRVFNESPQLLVKTVKPKIAVIPFVLSICMSLGAAAQTPVPPASSIKPLSAQRVQNAKMSEEFIWTADGGLKLAHAPAEKNSFWAAPFKMQQDGIVRATFNLGSHPDFSLLFRADFPNVVAEVSGYSVSIHRTDVQIHRWETGYPQPVIYSTKVKLPKVIDILITLKGPHFDIEIRDHATQKVIHTMAGDDASLRGNEIGYRVNKKQGKDTGLIALDFVAGEKYKGKWPSLGDPDAYLRQQPVVYVVVPEGTKSDKLKSCKAVSNAGIDHYTVYRCSHSAMMSIVDEMRRLPDGWFWSEPRNSFVDSEYRKAAPDLGCKVPMRCDEKQPVLPNRSTKDAAMIQAYIDNYGVECRKRDAHARIENIGTTWMGHEIRAVVLSNKAPDSVMPRVHFNGSHHGVELLATDFAFDVLEQLCETQDSETIRRYRKILDDVEVWVIPTVNLDGVDLYYHVSDHLGRKNGRGVFKKSSNERKWPAKTGLAADVYGYNRYRPNDIRVGGGVDINRNYPLHWGATGELSSSEHPRNYWYRGTAPASEPEIQSMMNMFHLTQFVSSISFHTVSTRILSPYSIDALQNPPHEKDQAWQLALKMAESAGMQANGKFYQVVKNLYSVDGTDQDWFRMVAGTTAYLIEGSMHNPTGAKRLEAIEKNRPAWQTFLDAAPASTIVRVRDESGQPLIAEVTYSDVPALNHEHWLTRCEDGTHAMLCFGTRQITVTLMDGTSQTKSASCGAHPTIIDFTFERPKDYSLEAASCASGMCENLYSVDTLCALRNNTCPSLPAQRYCLIDDTCVSAGTTKDLGVFRAFGTLRCDPRENNRYWILVEP